MASVLNVHGPTQLMPLTFAVDFWMLSVVYPGLLSETFCRLISGSEPSGPQILRPGSKNERRWRVFAC